MLPLLPPFLSFVGPGMVMVLPLTGRTVGGALEVSYLFWKPVQPVLLITTLLEPYCSFNYAVVNAHFQLLTSR